MRKAHKITYLYRDAGNYKFWGDFYVMGDISLSSLSPYLFDGEYFVPERIGVPSLVPFQKNDDDHLLHEFVSAEDADSTTCSLTAEEFTARVRAANIMGWI
jgi:hypothetical protein